MISAVTIRGQGLDPCWVLAQVMIMHGRGGFGDGAQPASATVVVEHPEGSMPPWASGDTVTIDHPDGRLFSGRVVQRSLRHLDDPGGGRRGQFTITAAGPLAALGVRKIGDEPWPQETGVQRAEHILGASDVFAWYVDGVTDLQVLARDVDAQPALNLLDELAGWTSGAVFDTPNGEVVYQPLEGRNHPVVPFMWSDFIGVPKIGDYPDDFDEFDSGRWYQFGTTAVTSGQLIVTPTNVGYSGVSEGSTHDLTSSASLVRVTAPPAAVGRETGFVLLNAGDTYGASMHVTGSPRNLKFRVRTAGSDTWVGGGVTYDPVVHAWWRIRLGGWLEFATSHDGVQWTTHAVAAVNPDNYTAMRTDLICGHWQAEASTPPAAFDNLNLAPGTSPAPPTEPPQTWAGFDPVLTWNGAPPSIGEWPSPTSKLPVVLPCTAVVWEPEWSSSESTVINHVAVGYGTAEPQAVVELEDADSIAVHQRRYLYLGTQLATAVDATARVTQILTTQAVERWEIGDVTVILDLLDPATRVAALNLLCGDHVTLQGLPQPAPATDWTGIVEGWTYTQYAEGEHITAQLNLTLSEPLLSLSVMQWSEYPGLYLWSEHPAYLTWDDLLNESVLEAA